MTLPDIREHPTFIGYGASSDGRVWSRHTLGGGLRDEWHRQLRHATNKDGYFVVGLKASGGKRVLVHRFVLECCVGPCPPHLDCTRHLDGDPTNNAVENLAWGTRVQNEADKVVHGTHNRGERHPHVKLTDSQVQAIRADGRMQRFIAADYGVDQSTISLIKTGRRWSHLQQRRTEPAA